MSPARSIPFAGLVFAAGLATLCLTACSKERVAGEQQAAADGCARCHGTPESQGAPPPSLAGATGTDVMEVGAHQAHLTAGRITGPVACTECHLVPHEIDDPGHMDASGTKVVFGPVASAGVTPVWNREQGTCTVHCHGANLAGGRVAAPFWTRVDGTQILCGSCHGAPPPAPHPQVDRCAGCHPSTVRSDGSLDIAGGFHVNGTVDVFSGHPAGWAAPNVHGFAAKDGLRTCQTCHGDDFGGGVSGVSCNACHGGAQWQTNCTFCHGNRDTGVPAPPRGTNGETASTDRAVGAHQTHVTAGGNARAFTCDVCHAFPTSLAHVDGNPSPRFGPLSRTALSNPVWDPATLTCSNVYCHGGTLSGGTLKTPKWTTVNGTQASCGACHGVPPPAPHPQNTSCGTCHTGYSSTTVNATTHVDGTVQLAPTSCANCHGVPPPAPHPQNSTCGTCHPGYTATSVVTRTHLDGTVQVDASSCGACHQIPPAAPHPQQNTCGTCHPGYTATTTNATTHMDGTIQANFICGTCHGIPPPAPHPQNFSCSTCHPGYTAETIQNTATHMDGTVQVNVTCGSCHAIPPPEPHPQIATCATCHPGYTATQVVTATHMDGTVQVNTACGSCHGIPPPNPHPQISTCGNCHPGYTSTTINDATHADGTVQANVTCGSCHAIPPATTGHQIGEHSFTSTCAICHAGYTTTTTGPGHLNGSIEVSAPGWNPDGKTCTNACHGTKTWPG